ncbi:PREDICTED: F-box protein CPR30-like [Fragaria vesca subsp. vesca]|uniref:F-box protein CPR30-like n=1 Tax=Fragaria vesca subsp. vesca TaxID=101020 RepID=UPI0002C36D8B|nr:PREDICTED: F-box protein CPR30-like [Fragaria vesca subsp. vesca]
MTETQELPEEIILNIFSRLPVKSLIRFTSVSKRLHFIILSDPKFAKFQLKAALRQRTQSRRLLVYTDAPQLSSLPLAADTPSFGDPSSVRKFTLPSPKGEYLLLLGSCNGLVFLTFYADFFYVWNPSTRFFKKLPDPGFSILHGNLEIVYCGVGYLSATDDYKLFIAYLDLVDCKVKVEMFSLTTHIWERLEAAGDSFDIGFIVSSQGTLLNEALHWLNKQIVCFDLAVKEFRRIPLPDFGHDGNMFCYLGLYEGCLCVLRYPLGVCYSVDFWVMREYGVSDSWTMLFSSKLSDPPEWGIINWPYNSRKLMVVESSTVASKLTEEGFELTKIDHKVGQKVGQYMLEGIRFLW